MVRAVEDVSCVDVSCVQHRGDGERGQRQGMRVSMCISVSLRCFCSSRHFRERLRGGDQRGGPMTTGSMLFPPNWTNNVSHLCLMSKACGMQRIGPVLVSAMHAETSSKRLACVQALRHECFHAAHASVNLAHASSSPSLLISIPTKLLTHRARTHARTHNGTGSFDPIHETTRSAGYTPTHNGPVRLDWRLGS